jgi:hypothetical protein
VVPNGAEEVVRGGLQAGGAAPVQERAVTEGRALLQK